MRKVSFLLITVIALIFCIVVISPFPSFADGPVTAVQFGSNSQVSSTIATCTLSMPVTAGDTLLMTLDAAFINRTTIRAGDSLHNTFTNFTIALNSASTWAWTFEARNIAHGGASDVLNFTYSDLSGRGTYTMTCAEFVGNVNFTQITGIGTLTGVGCNTCDLTMVNAGVHSVNYIAGWSEISTNPPAIFTLAYHNIGAPLPIPQTGSATVQTISGSSAGIVAFHAENDVAMPIANNGSGVEITCSPACTMSPAFVLTYSSVCLSVCGFTLTVTAWNTIDPATPTVWILQSLYLILVPAIFWGLLKGFHGKPSNTVFLTLLGLFIGSVLGTISGVELGASAIVPLGITVIFGISLGIFVVRSRSRGVSFTT